MTCSNSDFESAWLFGHNLYTSLVEKKKQLVTFLLSHLYLYLLYKGLKGSPGCVGMHGSLSLQPVRPRHRAPAWGWSSKNEGDADSPHSTVPTPVISTSPDA